jgi:hypothetical protein
MSTAEYTYVVATDAAIVGASNSAVDAMSSRALMSNINHLSDEFAQVRICMGSDGTNMPSAASGDTDVFLTSYIFPILQRASGDSYRFRIRLAGITPTPSPVQKLTAIIGPYIGAGRPVAATTYGDAKFIADISDDTGVSWGTGSSQGTNAWADLIELPAALVQTRDFQTKDIFGGSAVTASIPFAQLSIFGSGVSDSVTLNGVYLAEYIGT